MVSIRVHTPVEATTTFLYTCVIMYKWLYRLEIYQSTPYPCISLNSVLKYSIFDFPTVSFTYKWWPRECELSDSACSFCSLHFCVYFTYSAFVCNSQRSRVASFKPVHARTPILPCFWDCVCSVSWVQFSVKCLHNAYTVYTPCPHLSLFRPLQNHLCIVMFCIQWADCRCSFSPTVPRPLLSFKLSI